MRAAAVEELEGQGCHVDVSDLYAMRFKAVLDRNDFETIQNHDVFNVSLEQRFAWENQGLSQDIRSELESLLKADVLVLMFPLWWFGMPAILKGWIDRVFVSGAVYGRSAAFEKGHLAGKDAIVAVTTGAPASAFGAESLNGEIGDILMPLLRGVLGFTGMKVLPPFVGHHVPYIGDRERVKMMDAWRLYLRERRRLTPLPMPLLSKHPHALGAGVRAE